MFPKYFSFIGALVVGILTQSFVYGAELRRNVVCLASVDQELIYLMKYDGVRSRVEITSRDDLRDIVDEAERRALDIDPSCMVESVSEVRLNFGGCRRTLGYESLVLCEDTPSPAIALYFNSCHRFLGAVKLAN